jgi:hypothetical protein
MIEDTRTIDDPHWPQDLGFFNVYPERRHYARLMADGTTCIVRMETPHQRQHPVFLRVYGLIFNGDPEPEGEEACAEAWRQLARGS